MIKQIWKFKLDVANPEVEMPEGAKVLTAQAQRDDICIWAEVDTRAPRHLRRFVVYGTGHPMPNDPGTYLGTVVLFDGDFVFHIYEPN